MSEGLVLHLNKKGELQIPTDLRTGILSGLLNERVAMTIYQGSGGQTSNNRRIENPSVLFVDLDVGRKHRLHHNATFLPSGSNLERLLDGEQFIIIGGNGIIMLPENIRNLFNETNRRARILLLQRQRGEKIDGFALSFQPKFPTGSNGRI